MTACTSTSRGAVSIRSFRALMIAGSPMTPSTRHVDGGGLLGLGRQLVFERPHDVVVNDLEPPAGCQRADVYWPPSVKIVDADHMVALTHQVFGEMRTEKARAACHYNAKIFPRDHTC